MDAKGKGPHPMDCFLCPPHDCGELVPWYDRALLASEAGFVVAGLGAFVPGYLLVAPRHHVQSIAQMSLWERDLLLTFLDTVVRKAEREFGEYTLYEHGGSPKRKPQSACISHAHIHLLPGHYGLLHSLPDASLYAGWQEALAQVGNRTPYLAVQESTAEVAIAPDPGVPQYFRRQVARALGHDRWDYAIFPNFDEVLSTQLRFLNSSGVSERTLGSPNPMMPWGSLLPGWGLGEI